MNSSKSIVPSPFTSYSITKPKISSSVGFCPIDLNTGRSSFVVIVPLPSYNLPNKQHKVIFNVYKVILYLLKKVFYLYAINITYVVVVENKIIKSYDGNYLSVLHDYTKLFIGKRNAFLPCQIHQKPLSVQAFEVHLSHHP